MDSALPDLIDRIRAAAAQDRRLRIRGGGTKDFYGEPAPADGAAPEVLSTTGLIGIVAYEPSELVVTVRAGTRLADLEATLAAQGQCLAFEPPHFGPGATVGGMVAAGLSGPARASVGSVRDFVLGVTMVNGRGEVLVFGGQVMKNVAGYDVSRLLAGSLGTLGVIAEVSLKVLPVAPAEATLRFELPQQAALERLNAWGGQPLPLNASDWVLDAGVPTLYLRLRGAAAAVEAACRKLGGDRLAQVDDAWVAARELTLPWFNECGARDLWRLSVPQTAPVLALPESPFIQWHGAQRWVRAEPGAREALAAVARAVGGSATLFRPADPQARGRFAPLVPPLDRIHRDLRREFDPAGLFDTGRLYPDL